MNVILISSAAHNAGLGTVIGFAILAIIILVAAIRFTILDLVQRRERKARQTIYVAMKAENNPAWERDWQAFRAELEARLAAK